MSFEWLQYWPLNGGQCMQNFGKQIALGTFKDSTFLKKLEGRLDHSHNHWHKLYILALLGNAYISHGILLRLSLVFC